jgi:hypothetical protein
LSHGDVRRRRARAEAPTGMSRRRSIDDRTRLFAFFTQEVEAYIDVYRSKDEDGVLKALCHALFWACALDEWLKRRHPSSHEGFVKSDPDGEVMKGLRYARNRVVHQFQQLLYLGSGPSFPIRLPVVFFEYKWKPSARLPPPDLKYPQADLRAAYDARLARKAARHTLSQVRQFFGRARDAF